jgi:peroxiredoxin (alkyl hydroperoxide reductase subunit C)
MVMETRIPLIGEKFPESKVVTDHWKMQLPDAFKGKWFILFSHLKWTEWIKEKPDVKIQFPIIAATGKAASTLGLIHPDKGTNTVRAVF